MRSCLCVPSEGVGALALWAVRAALRWAILRRRGEWAYFEERFE